MCEKIDGLTEEEFNKLPREEQTRIMFSLLNAVDKEFGGLVADHIETGEIEYEKGIDIRLSMKKATDGIREMLSHPIQQPDAPQEVAEEGP